LCTAFNISTMKHLSVLFFLFIPLSCCYAVNQADSIPFVEIEKGKALVYKWQPEWNKVIAEAIEKYGSILLDPESLPLTQINELCPGFKNGSANEKKAFWVLVIAAIAKYESNFDPSTRYKEGHPLYVYSEGLLQLSYGDEKNHAGLPIDPAKQNILDPSVNLTSGVIILCNQLRKRKVLFTDKPYYWSVLSRKQADIKKFIRDHIAQLNFCQSS
jgi:hypothetical protein